MLASDWSTRDHMITVDKSEAPVSRFYSQKFSRRYFGGDWKPGNTFERVYKPIVSKPDRYFHMLKAYENKIYCTK